MTIPENKTLFEDLIKGLKKYKEGGLADTGARTPLDGFNQAMKIMRMVSLVHSMADQGDRLIRAFEEYTHTQKHSQTFRVDNCSECSGAHGDVIMMLWKGDGVKRYWYLCPVLLQAAYHFPENGGD